MVVVVVAEEEMETEEDEADSKRHHVVHSMNGVVCIPCRPRRFFFVKKPRSSKTKDNIHEHGRSYLINCSLFSAKVDSNSQFTIN